MREVTRLISVATTGTANSSGIVPQPRSRAARTAGSRLASADAARRRRPVRPSKKECQQSQRTRRSGRPQIRSSRKRPSTWPGDEAVARADQMQHIDDAAIGIEHRAGGEDHDGDRRQADQDQHRIGDSFDRRPAMRVSSACQRRWVSRLAPFTSLSGSRQGRRNRAARSGRW